MQRERNCFRQLLIVQHVFPKGCLSAQELCYNALHAYIPPHLAVKTKTTPYVPTKVQKICQINERLECWNTGILEYWNIGGEIKGPWNEERRNKIQKTIKRLHN